MSNNPLYKSQEEQFINNDPQYNFGGWVPPIAFVPAPTPSPTPSPTASLTPTPTTTPTPTPTPSTIVEYLLLTQDLNILQTAEGDNIEWLI